MITLRSRSNQGLSLVEVMIIMGISMMIGLGIASVLTWQRKVQTDIQAGVDFSAVSNHVLSILNNPSTCKYAFSQNGQTFDGTEKEMTLYSQSSDSSSIPVLAAGKNLPGWKVISLKVKQKLAPVSSLVDSVDYLTYSSTLTLKAQRTTNVGVSSGAEKEVLKVREVTFPLTITTRESDQTIFSCSSATSPAQATCQALGGTYQTATADSPEKCRFTDCDSYSDDPSCYCQARFVSSYGSLQSKEIQSCDKPYLRLTWHWIQGHGGGHDKYDSDLEVFNLTNLSGLSFTGLTPIYAVLNQCEIEEHGWHSTAGLNDALYPNQDGYCMFRISSSGGSSLSFDKMKRVGARYEVVGNLVSPTSLTGFVSGYRSTSDSYRMTVTTVFKRPDS